MEQKAASDARAKIICTLGPASSDLATIKALTLAGMNVVRLNFSHGTHDQHRELVRTVRQAAEETGKLLAIMLDLQGPKIRVGRFKDGSARLEQGAAFTITTRPVEGDEHMVSTSYGALARDLSAGATVLLDDGLLALRVAETNDTDLKCEVVTGGILKDNKGINLPGVALSVATLTEKDVADVQVAVDEAVDYVAMSFVRRPEDIRELRELLASKGAQIPLVAKIEKPEALECIDEVIAVSDGIMVARGDLGVEMPTEDVPGIQKSIIAKCNRAGVPVITATQMLDSMVNNPRPTRAEASDVANAVLDGSDAVMLSAESASGKYPLEAVQVMRRIILATEMGGHNADERLMRWDGEVMAINQGVALAACTIADHVGAGAIVSITLSGSMARAISRYRPKMPIFAISQRAHELRRLCLVWGIEGLFMPDLQDSVDDAVRGVEELLKSRGKLRPGERFVLTAGVPFSARQATNMVRVDTIR